jgi:HD-like signal output (HDOD) protein
MESAMLSIEGFEQRALATGSQFPFGSKVLEYLVDLINDPRATAARLSAVIGWNPMLVRSVAAQVGTTYGVPGRVRDVDLAVAALGSLRLRETMKRAVAGIATRHLVRCFESCPELWNHLLTCALVSRAIARRLGVVDPSHAFLAGLVHDVGFLLLVHEPFSGEGETRPVWIPESDIADPEQTLNVALHEEAGSWMVDRWETLPGDVRDAVLYHHAPGDAEGNPLMAAVVHVADVLCHREIGGPLGQWPSFAPDPAALKLLQIEERECQEAEHGTSLAALQQEILNDLPALSLKVAVLRESLVTGLEDLLESERLVLALHYCEGIALRSIAGVLDISVDDVRMVHGAALGHLEAVLNEVGEEL